MKKVKRLKLIINVWLLKRKTRKLAKKSGVEHFLIMWKGKPEILSKDGFKHMRQHGLFPLSFTANELKKIAIYHVK